MFKTILLKNVFVNTNLLKNGVMKKVRKKLCLQSFVNRQPNALVS